MKTLIVLLSSLAITACSAIPDPKVSFGKKCVITGDRVTYSYVWVYDGKTGLQANPADCAQIEKKK
jgi:hypothetical protein